MRGKTSLVVRDGNRAKEQVLQDFETYSPLVTPGSDLIVENWIIDLFRPRDGIGQFDNRPLAAVGELLVRHPEFTVDARRERYVITYNPRGFLRRIP